MEQRYEEGVVDVDAWLNSGHSDTAVASRGAASCVVPNFISSHQETLGYGDPKHRLSWSKSFVLIDHPGLRYDPAQLREPGQEPSSRTTDICWLHAIDTLIKASGKGGKYDINKLWSIIVKKTEEVCMEEASKGMSISMVKPIFEELDREVAVFDGNGDLVYHRKREVKSGKNRKCDHIVPHEWVFVMSEDHVYSVEPALLGSKRAKTGDRMEVHFRKKLQQALKYAPRLDSPSRVVPRSCMLPKHEKTVPRILKPLPSSKESLPTKVVFLVPTSSANPEYATLQEILFDHEYSSCDLHVVVQANLLYTVIMRLVRESKYRPSVSGISVNHIISATVQSIKDRGTIRFVNPYRGKRIDRKGM